VTGEASGTQAPSRSRVPAPQRTAPPAAPPFWEEESQATRKVRKRPRTEVPRIIKEEGTPAFGVRVLVSGGQGGVVFPERGRAIRVK
jgi:hypothetical protein